MRRVEHGWHEGCTENGIKMAGEKINAIDTIPIFGGLNL